MRLQLPRAPKCLNAVVGTVVQVSFVTRGGSVRNEKAAAEDRLFKPSDTWCYGCYTGEVERETSPNSKQYWSVSTALASPIPAINAPAIEIIESDNRAEPEIDTPLAEMPLADFVETRFVP